MTDDEIADRLLEQAYIRPHHSIKYDEVRTLLVAAATMAREEGERS